MHTYKSIWTRIIVEELVVKVENDNEHNYHAVVVMKDGCVVGHVHVPLGGGTQHLFKAQC